MLIWHGCTLECIASSVARIRGKNAGSSGSLDGMLVSCPAGLNPALSTIFPTHRTFNFSNVWLVLAVSTTAFTFGWVFLFLEVEMSEISKYRQSEEAAWNLLDAERQATERLREQVAAQAAVIEKLREALPDTLWFLERYSNRWDGINGKHPNCVVETAREALSIPTDSTQILAEVRRAERERCISAITHAWHKDPCYLRDLTDAIQAME